MGANKSKGKFQKPAEIQVLIESNVVSSGEDLIGTIGLLVTERIDYDAVFLELLGHFEIEWVVIQYVGKKKKRRLSRKVIKLSWPHIAYKTKLFVWPDLVIMPGQYNLPFSIRIPSGLPSSFSWTNRQAKARIFYTLGVSVMPEVEDSIEFTVHQKEGLPMYDRKVQRIANVKRLCFTRGEGKSTATLDKQTYFLGETIFLTVNYDFSRCLSKPHSYVIQLKYVINLYDGGSNRMNYSGTLDSITKPCQDDTGSLEFGLVPHGEGIEKLATVISQCIRCEFFLVVTPKFGCCVCGSALSTEVRLIMTSKDSTLALYTAPENWNPLVMKPTALDLSEIEATMHEPTAPPLEE